MISICVITRDEREKLKRLIESVSTCRCELVVVDTGSVDGTLEMLEEAKVRYAGKCSIVIEKFAWINDFAAAKNYAASKASNEYVMILDSDEWLIDPKALRIEPAKHPDAVGRIRRLNLIELAGEERVNREWINRIYSRERFCYRGMIHEQLVRTDVSGEAAEQYETYTTPVEIYHDGYLGTPEEKQRKANRNIELLNLELSNSEYLEKKERKETTEKYYQTEKQVPYVLYQLGKSYYMAGDYAQAAEYLGEALFFDLDERLEYVIDLVEAYGYALINSGRAADALMLEGVYDAFAHTADFQFLMGLIYMQNARFQDAVAEFEKAMKNPEYRMQGVNSYLAAYNAGVIREVLGDRTAAAAYYRKAGSYPQAKEGLARLEQAQELPILIIYGVRYCYNILNEILSGMEEAFRRAGYQVETYDEQEGDVAGLSAYVGRHFRAVIAVQTYLFGVYLEQSGKFLFDEIHGPKWNIVLDHPGWLSHLFRRLPEQTYVLTHDTNYRAFVERYYGAVSRAYHFPMAGSAARAKAGGRRKPVRERRYRLVFIGTYGDYREKCAQIRELKQKELRRIANRYLLTMRRNTGLTAEEAFARTLVYYGITYDDARFLELFSGMNTVLQCVMYYYREKTVRAILDAGIALDIWGGTWKAAPFADHPMLTLHEEVTPEASFEIMEDAAMSLNIMAWHKGGFTERMANTMLSGAVLVTDDTTFFEDHDDSGVVRFSLDRMEELTARLHGLLDPADGGAQLDALARAGYENAVTHHTWDVRVREWMEISAL